MRTNKNISMYDQEPLLECNKLKIISVYSASLFVISLYFNLNLLHILFKYKHLRTRLNTLIMSISVLNLIGTIIEFPLLTLSNFYCKWIFKKFGCYLSGFLIYSIACSTIYLMMVISLERLKVIRKPYIVRNTNPKLEIVTILVCILAGVFWALLPIFGWSYYSLEGVKTTCSVEWSERSFNVQSYNVSIMLLTFLVPLLIILLSNLKIIYLLRKKSHNFSTNGKWLKKRIKKERRTTITTLFLIFGFIVCWSPYAFVCILRMLNLNMTFSPLEATIPSLFAKLSMPWNAIFYLFSHREMFNKFRQESLCCCYNRSTKQNNYKTRKDQLDTSSSMNGKSFL